MINPTQLKMKKYIIIIILMILISGCVKDQNPFSPWSQDCFTITLLADSTITAIEAADKPIEALNLAPTPLITTEDMVFYQWSHHRFSLKPDTDKALKKVVSRQQTVFGIPFITTVGDDRIYLGAFWFIFSSVAPHFPTIEVGMLLGENNTTSIFTIEKTWFDEEEDKRNDPRIYQALKKAGVLLP
jgi:hypothetical protein